MTQTEPFVFDVDPEHTGLRLAVVLILFVALWVSYILVRWLLASFAPQLESPTILACIGAFPLSLFFGWVAENMLKRNWPSGRKLLLARDSLRLQRPPREDEIIHLDEPVQQLWWSFSLSDYPRGGRERRLPATWRCAAGQLRQDDTRILPYCFVPANRVEEWEAQYDFELLKPGDVYDTSLTARLAGPSRPELSAEVVAGEQGRYWLAERHRWQEGVEMTPDDFHLLLQQLHPITRS